MVEKPNFGDWGLGTGIPYKSSIAPINQVYLSPQVRKNQYFGILDRVRSKLVYARSGLEIMSYVESGNADAGIVHDSS